MEEGQVVRRDKISGFLERAIWWSLVAMIVAIPPAETPKTMVRDRPLLGVGAKCFMASRVKYQLPGDLTDLRQTHYQVLNVGAETGIIGLAAFFAWIGYYTVFLFKLAWSTRNNLAKALWLSAIGSFVTIVLHGMVDASFGSELALLFLLIAGCLIVAQGLGSSREERAI